MTEGPGRGEASAKDAWDSPGAGPRSGPDGPEVDAWARRFDINARGVGSMFARLRDVFLKTWRLNLVPPLIEPVLYLLALGYGLGALVEEVDGMPYVVFLAPALVTITMMQTAFFETTYSSFVRMYFQKTWDAVVATPLTIEDIMVAELVFASVRAMVYSTIMSLVVAAFGLLTFPSAFLIPLLALLVGGLFAGLGLMATAKMTTIDSFGYVFYLFITPQFLFAGTFFPLSQLPDLVQHAALLLPLTNCVILVRSAVHGVWDPLVPWALGYVLVVGAATWTTSVLWMKRRLVT